MKSTAFRWAATVAVFALPAGCTTANQNIETSTSPASGQLAENLIVLGVASRVTYANMPATSGFDSGPEFAETVTLNDVPLGTRMIVPVVTGWDLGYGTLDPDNQLAAQPPSDHAPGWSHSERTRWFGRARVDVSVLHVRSANPGAPFQTADIRVVLRVADDFQDDAWWGGVRYQLIYLGTPTRR